MCDVWLGLDGGGTKVRAVASDVHGTVLAGATAGPCNLAAVGASAALSAVSTALSQLITDLPFPSPNVRAIALGVAGYSHSEELQTFQAGLKQSFPGIPITIVPDYELAFYGAFADPPGVVTIAGTGSIAFGMSPDRRTLRSGGYGHIIDDAGSGYGMGRMALCSVLRAADGTGPQTQLTEVVLQQIGLNSARDIVSAVYGGSLDRLRIAALAQIVIEISAESDDEPARAIVHTAAAELAAMTSRILNGLELPTNCGIACVGGLWSGSQLLHAWFGESLAAIGYTGKPFLSQSAPTAGATQLALRSTSTTPQ